MYKENITAKATPMGVAFLSLLAEEEGNEYNPYPTAFQYLRSGSIKLAHQFAHHFFDCKFYYKYTVLMFEFWNSKE